MNWGSNDRATGTYNAVPLPANPFSCSMGVYINAQSDWMKSITFNQNAMGTGMLGLASGGGGAHVAGQTGYPICNNHA